MGAVEVVGEGDARGHPHLLTCISIVTPYTIGRYEHTYIHVLHALLQWRESCSSVSRYLATIVIDYVYRIC